MNTGGWQFQSFGSHDSFLIQPNSEKIIEIGKVSEYVRSIHEIGIYSLNNGQKYIDLKSVKENSSNILTCVMKIGLMSVDIDMKILNSKVYLSIKNNEVFEIIIKLESRIILI